MYVTILLALTHSVLQSLLLIVKKRVQLLNLEYKSPWIQYSRCVWLSQFVANVTIIIILFMRCELWLKKQLSIVLFGFFGYHVMSVIMSLYSMQLIEGVSIVNVDKTLKIVTYPVSSSSVEITVARDKWKGPKNVSCCWDMIHCYSVLLI